MEQINAKDVKVSIGGQEISGFFDGNPVIRPEAVAEAVKPAEEDPILQAFRAATNREQKRAVVHKFGARNVAKKLKGVFSRVKSVIAFNFTEDKAQRNALKRLRNAA